MEIIVNDKPESLLTNPMDFNIIFRIFVIGLLLNWGLFG